ncbi:tripartite tricarboxylate transporter substrate binding protein [Ramlibacter sp.]|uniref:Bug family tripartite tricarboxylate transporter substrate binding protein n=1 Tax=Ramlibacter sp. TaxID=1917967 RepID=UPI002608D0B0|nr:tripartite tricarboxylate transporter substrate binding protein [Ramlibacter sp.]MDB5953652.1 tripartite tricarboxylate transporter substrate binding protein [Ramlibacter sp.]
MMNRRNCVALLAAAPFATLAESAWPKGTVTVVVPLAAGDGGDTTARVMCAELSHDLGVPVVVSNRPGAGGALGVQQVIGAKKDGYTLLFTQNSPLTVRRVLEPTAASYDPLRELEPLAITTRTPSVLVVRQDAPFNSFRDLVAYAKKHPHGVRIGNAGPGSAGDLSVQVVNAQIGMELPSIPYKGAAPAVTDLIGGQVEAAIVALGAVSSHLNSGTLAALAISHPFPKLPTVTTLTRLGYRQDLLGVWFAWLAPSGVPPEVTRALLPALQKAARSAELAARLLPLGIAQDWVPGNKLASEISDEFATVTDLTKRMQRRKS